jgi:hypothetical protein
MFKSKTQEAREHPATAGDAHRAHGDAVHPKARVE